MYIQFVPDGASDTPLLLMSSPSSGELSELTEVIKEMARGDRTQVTLHDVGNPKSRISLCLAVSDGDSGISGPGPAFRCSLRTVTWDQIQGLIEPFASDKLDGYQWLDESGSIALLLSPSGEW